MPDLLDFLNDDAVALLVRDPLCTCKGEHDSRTAPTCPASLERTLEIPRVASASDPQFAFLTAALRRAAVVRSLLAFNASISYPPTSVVTSHYNTSMESGNFTIDTTRHSVNWAAVGAPRPGDGSVCEACAVPPYTPSAGVFVSTHASYSRHFLLMNDVVTLKAAMDAIPYPSSPVPAT